MIIPSSVTSLLFDMDGTLVNTEPVGPQTFLLQLKRYNATPTPSEETLFTKIWRRDGTTIDLEEWLPEMARKHGIIRKPAGYLKEFYDMYEEGIFAAPALPGVDDFLQKLKQSKKYKTALVTASKKIQAEDIIVQRHWEKVFDAIVSEEDITKHKPDPEPFLIGMKRLGVSSEHCAIFEDSKNGAIAGKASGAYVIGLRVGNRLKQDLHAADAIVWSFEDVNP